MNVLSEAICKAKRWYVRIDSAHLLSRIGGGEEKIINALWRGLLDSNDDVRTACARALAKIGRRSPPARKFVSDKLLQAIQKPEFEKPDSVVGRSAHDYAFDALWLLEVGGEIEEV